jgi:peptidoglycan hydrolase CwlO-like protein
MIAKLNLPLCAAFVWLLMCAPAAAQSQADDDKLEQLQRRTEMLERELKALRQEIKKTKKDADKAEKVDKVEKSEPVQGPSKRPWSRAMH